MKHIPVFPQITGSPQGVSLLVTMSSVFKLNGKLHLRMDQKRQKLHEIPEASRSVVVSASLIKCPLIWDSAIKLNLSINNTIREILIEFW